jgi:hypothetical protein
MANSTREARGRRSQARERRRAQQEAPPAERDQATPPADPAAASVNGNLGGTAAKVVGTAVAAGLLGALGGAVKAFLERRERDGESRGGEDETKTDVEPSASEGRPAEQEEPDVEPPASEERPAEQEEPDRGSSAWEDETDASAEEPADPRSESNDTDASDDAEVDGLSHEDASEIVSTARRELEALLATDIERVSGLGRKNGHWSVLLEVVEMARIPESTDILATYEVILDDDGGLIGVSRVRRYRRSQVEEEV